MDNKPFRQGTIDQFLDDLGSKKAAPGGGASARPQLPLRQPGRPAGPVRPGPPLRRRRLADRFRPDLGDRR